MPKIVIKPRTAPTVEDEALMDDQEEEDDDQEIQNENEEENENENDNENENENEIDNQPEESSPLPPSIPLRRPRGRPRGSRGISTRGTASGSTTPRARGRGRGRGGRGRGRGSILIKLPRRGDDDTEGDDDPGEGGEAEDGDGPPLLDVDEKEPPIGGGKPFRSIQGKIYVIDGDEFITEDDPKGDEKIDKFGNLLGSRKFKASTFALPNRHPQRQYLLAIDAARTSGFRDSLYYFRRNTLALKLNATQSEKDYLITEGKLGSHLKTRNVTLVTARSAFKLHGSKMLIDGRWVTDDYYESKVLEEITSRGLKAGELVGELPDPNAQHQHNTELSSLIGTASLDRGALSGAGGGAGSSGGGIYRAGGPTTIFGGSGWGPYSDGPLNAVRKSILSRDGVTEENWMWMMSLRVREVNDEWTARRKESVKALEFEDGLFVAGRAMGAAIAPVGEKVLNPGVNDGGPGVYEPQTNCILYRSYSQPTSSRWEIVSASSPTSANPKGRVVGGTKVGNGAWGLAWVDTVMESSNGWDVDAQERERILREVAAEEERDAEPIVMDLS